MNNWSITGRIGKDAVTRSVNNNSVTSWSVAVKSGYGGREQTIWVDCSMWGDRGERVAGYLLKGGLVGVCGEVGTREHDGNTYITLKVSEVSLLGNREDSGQRRNDRPQRDATSQASRAYRDASGSAGSRERPPVDNFADDDIPF